MNKRKSKKNGNPQETEESDGVSDDMLRLATGIATEQGRFLRRTCPSCGRDFKTEIDPAQLQWLIAPALERIGPAMGFSLEGEGSRTSGTEEHFFCPYCLTRSEAPNTLTEETVRYLHQILMREVVLPMMHSAFSPDANQGGRSGLFSVTFEYERGILPQRPFHGPEPTDMKPVVFLCCAKHAKISESWKHLHHCIYCGTPITLV